MKYIRTKDGRILRDIDCENFSIEDYSNYMNGVYKEADTIEELCDEFVIHYANGYHLITINDGEITFKDDFDYGFKLKFALENGYEIYGSIWVGADLHSVAKMNDKGELELL